MTHQNLCLGKCWKLFWPTLNAVICMILIIESWLLRNVGFYRSFLQFYKYLNNNDLLYNCQSGFKSFHSTQTPLRESSDSYSFNIEEGLINCVILQNFHRFKIRLDTIDHNIHLRKLATYGIEQGALKWFDPHLSGRRPKCLVDGELPGGRDLRQIYCYGKQLYEAISRANNIENPRGWTNTNPKINLAAEPILNNYRSWPLLILKPARR